MFSIFRIFQTINQDRTLYGIPSIGENSFVSTSQMNRLVNLSEDDNGSDNQIDLENETEQKDEDKPPPPKRKRLEDDGAPYKIKQTKITISQSDGQMNKAILIEGNHRLATILNEEYASSGYEDFRVPVTMYEIDDGDFNKAYTNCLDLKVCETSQERSRVNLEGIPGVVLHIAILKDSVVFVLSYLQKIVSNKEIESMRSHPHKRSEFWRTLDEKGLVVPAGNSNLPMTPLYFLLMRPSTQKISLKKLEDDDFRTTHWLVVTACNASLANDEAAATMISKHPPMKAVKIEECLQKLTNKANVEMKAVDDAKTNVTEFVVHALVEDIPDSARCFFFQRLPKESIQKIIDKKLHKIVIARPTSETLGEMAIWWSDQRELEILHESAYDGDGTQFPCAILGPGLIAIKTTTNAPTSSTNVPTSSTDVPTASKNVPISSTKLLNLFQNRFSGEKDSKIHTVIGYYEVSK
ncbi:hypothetical protein CRE_30946 [Caenorhabditis remanei]|uniref:Uncharacterized protein n=1 Tax=Caenorhabditis remanei TaxID=31234 RepID=E3LTP6_CAERE|nr:hypothetical protein CRE_30946 [Caenorhabditis remanei]